MRTKDPEKIPAFGRRLSALRRARHLTQQDLAEAVGMTRQMISYLESRAPNPTIELVRTLADFFEVSADALVYDEPDRRRPGQLSKLEQQFQELRKLSKSKQKTVSDMIQGALIAERNI